MTKILVIGACGQIGVDLVPALREKFGGQDVIASDIREENPLLHGQGPFVQMDALDKDKLARLVQDQNVKTIYHLAALVSAVGEQNPELCWQVNMGTLKNVLDVAVEAKAKVYWPSSIAIFGPTTPSENTPQRTVVEPTTMYGVTKYAGEMLCQYYNKKFGLDVRSLRYPGLISWKGDPGGGTTDYAVDIFYKALRGEEFSCFLSEHTYLPMMYMNDGIRATIELMEAPAEKIKNRMSYNLAAMSFSPEEIAAEVKKHIPNFKINYAPDFRQAIADSWPKSIDNSVARADWGWRHEYDLAKMTEVMLKNLKVKLNL